MNPQPGTDPSRPRRRLRLAAVLLSVAAAALLATALAEADKPVTVKTGNLELTISGGVTPKALSKTKLEPIGLNVEGKFGTVDGTQPPAIREIIVDTDKNGTIDARGVPVCKAGQLEAQPSAKAEQICKDAIVGTGTTDVTVAFAEQQPIPVHSKLIAFNGGIAGNTTTILVHAFITVPIAAAIVTKVKITKEHNGPYGTHSVATVPRIAGGAGSVTGFRLTFQKRLFPYKGKEHGYLLAKCASGRFLAQVETIFADGTKVGPARISRPCTPKP